MNTHLSRPTISNRCANFLGLWVASLGLVLAAVPDNDQFARATLITGTTAQVTGSNVDATMEAGEPTAVDGWVAGQSVWWRWVAPFTGSVGLTTAGTNIGNGFLMLAVYTGTAPDALTVVAADAGSYARTTALSFRVTSGVTYSIAAYSWSNVTGTIPLTLHTAVAVPERTQRVLAGANFTLGGFAVTGTAPFTYQWRKNGVDLVGSTMETLPLTGLQLADAGTYDLVVSSALGSTSARTTLTVETLDGGVKSLGAAWHHTLWVKNDSTLWSVGYNSYGQLGDGTIVTRSVPSQVDTGVAAVAAGGGFHSLFIKNNGSLWAIGANGSGQLGDGSNADRSNAVSVDTGVTQAAAGGYHSLYLKTDATLWGMGQGTYGQLGRGSTASVNAPVPIASGVAAVAAGDYHTLYVTTEGKLFVTGYNNQGQLGDGTNVTRTSAHELAAGVVAAAAGWEFSVFLKGDGTLWGMGFNGDGALGDGTTTSRNTPGLIATQVAAVAASSYAVHFLKTDGTLWATGRNSNGQLGDGTTTGRLRPVLMASEVEKVAGGHMHAAMAGRDGALWTYGYNGYGQLGDGTIGQREFPFPIVPGRAAAPTIVTAPQAVAVALGQPATLTVVAAGTAPRTYQWRKGGNAVPGATTATLALAATRADDTGAYDVVVTNGVGSATSATAALDVLSPPAYSPALADRTVVAGDAVMFTVTVTGNPAPALQWRKDGSDLPGATRLMLHFLPVTPADAGNYELRLTNSQGTVTSPPFALVVQVPAGIAVQPQPLTLAQGGTAIFSVTATGHPAPTYRWFKDTAPIPGATDATFSVANVTPADAGRYAVQVDNGVGSAVMSNLVALVVRVPPTITAPPAAQSVAVGADVSFTVGAAGTAPLAYQWKKDGAAIPGATAATLVLSQVQLAAAGSYTVVVSNGASPDATSPAATLTVVPVGAQGITPDSIGNLHAWYSVDSFVGAYAEGQAVMQWPDRSGHGYTLAPAIGVPSIYRAALNGHPGVRFQQQEMRTSMNFGLGGDAAFTLFLVGAIAHPGTGLGMGYAWPIGWGTGTASGSALVVELEAGDGRLDFATGYSTDANSDFRGPWTLAHPRILSGRRATAEDIGGTIIRVDGVTRPVTGTPGAISFVDTPLAVGLSGSVDMILSEVIVYSRKLSATEEDQVGSYLAKKYSLASGYSGAPTVPVVGGVLAVSGSTTTAFGYQITASQAPTSYTATPLPPGLSLEASTGLISGTPTAAGTYAVTLTATNGVGTSLAATLTLVIGAGPLAPSMITQPESPVVAAGATVTLAASAMGSAPLSYQWMKGNAPLTDGTAAGLAAVSGALTPVLTLSGVQAGDAALYRLEVRNSAGYASSNPAAVTVGAAGVAPVFSSPMPRSQTTVVGQNIVFSVNAAGSPPLSYQWKKDGVALADGTNPSLTLNSVALAAAGVYSVAVSNAQGSITTGDLRLTVAAARPANDNFAQAAVLSGATATVGSSNIGATLEAGERDHGPYSEAGHSHGGASVWFQWTAPAAGAYTLELTVAGGGYLDALLGIYTGSTLDTLTRVWSGYGQRVTFFAAAGVNYHLAVDGSFGSASDFSLALTPATGSAPALLHPPMGQGVLPGQDIYLNVMAAGTEPMAYQWKKGATTLVNGDRTSGATSPTLRITAAQAGDAGDYSVVAANELGSVTAGPIAVVVSDPVIAYQPQALTVNVGEGASFGAYALGTAPLTYRWRKGTSELSDNGNITGSATASLALSNVQPSDAGSYFLVVRNGAGVFVTSAPVVLTVNAPAGIPVITSAVTATATVGTAFSFQVVASNAPTSFAGTGLPPGLVLNSASGVLSGLPTTVGTYPVSLTATNAAGPSAATLLTITVGASASAPANDNFAQAQELLGASGTVTAANVGATGESGEPSHVTTAGAATSIWFRWTPAQAGAATVSTDNSSIDTVLAVYTGSALGSLVKVGEDDDGGGTARASKVAFTAAAGTTYFIAVGGFSVTDRGSISLNWTSGAAPLVPVITSASTASATVGTTFSYTITASNAPTSFHAAGLPPGLSLGVAMMGAILGVPTTAGTYPVTLTGTNAAGTGPAFTLTITVGGSGLPLALVSHPQSLTTTVGSPAAFVVVATGATTYQWKKDGVDLPGETGVSLSLTSVPAGAAGVYSVIVGNGTSTLASNGAVLTVGATGALPLFAAAPRSQTALVGGTVTFAVSMTGTAPFGYQWRRNGLDLPGATQATLLLTNVQLGDAASFQVRVNNSAGTIESGPLALNVAAAAPANDQFAAATVLAGTAATVAGANVGATLESGEPDHRGPGAENHFHGGNSVWWTWTAPAAGTWRVDTVGSTFDTLLAVYTGHAVNALTLVGADDQGGGAGTSALTFAAAGGTTYRFAVDGFAGATGTIALNLAPATATAPAFTVQPASRTVAAGTDLLLGAAWTATAPYTLQWRRNGVDLPGATLNPLALPSIQSADAGDYVLVVTNALGAASSNPAAITVSVPAGTPVITGASSATATVGVAFTYAIAAAPTPTSFFARGLPAGLTLNSTTGVISGLATTVGSYPVLLSAANPAGTGAALVLMLTVAAPTGGPGIVTPPASQSVAEGGSVTFTVVASGTSPLAYQWIKNTTPIANATGAALTLSGLQAGDAADYRVQVSNSVGTVYSPFATLTVLLRPQINTQPQSQTVALGGSVHLLVIVNSQGTPTFQWKKNGIDLTGVTGFPFYDITNAQAGDAGTYTVVVTNSGGSVTSDPAVVTVTGGTVAPVISAQPQAQTVAVGSNATFSVGATGSPAPTYQWRRNGLNVPGGTGATLILNSVQAGDAGTYTVLVTNSAGQVLSSGAALTVSVPVAAPTITTAPLSQAVTAGGSVTLSVTAAGAAPLLYQWKKNDANLPGATGTTLALTSVTAADAANYTVVVSNAGGSVTSAPASLTVNTPVSGVWAILAVSGPAIYTPAGGNLTLTATIGYAGLTPSALGYTINLPTGWALVSTGGPNTPGSAPDVGTTAALEFAYTSIPVNQASFSVVVSYPAGLSGNQTLTASAIYRSPLSTLAVPSVVVARVEPPVITAQPANKAAVVGSSVTFVVTATSSANVTYQWRKGGETIAGATGSSLTLANVQTGAAGGYDVVVTNVAGSVTSAVATLAVIDVRATHAVNGNGYLPGGTVTISNTITYVGSAAGLGWQVLLPAGWSYASGAGSEGDVRPSANTTDLLEWAWTTIPASPLTFTYTLNVPSGNTGEKSLAGLVVFRQAGSLVQFLATPDPLVVPEAPPFHAADTNGNYKISLLELTRVIELYNTRNGTSRTGCYRVEAGSEDGFNPEPTRSSGAVVTLAKYHSADSDRNGKVSLLELTRVIELYNYRVGTSRTGDYHVHLGSEDGYNPGPASVHPGL